MTRHATLGYALLLACGPGGVATTDAASAADASIEVDARMGMDAAPDAAALDAPATDVGAPVHGHTLFLQFAGGAFHPGADDSATNTTSLVSSPVTLAAFAESDATRDAVVAEVELLLAPYDLAVVTTRPAAGSYTLVSVGGTASQIGLPAGIQSIAPSACTPLDHAIALVFDVDPAVHSLASRIVSMVGTLARIPPSAVAGDCMCFTDTACFAAPLSSACTIGGPGTPMSTQESCETVAPFDEGARFLAAFGAAP